MKKILKPLFSRMPRRWLACDHRSLAGGIAVGLFVGWLPLPLQSVLAGGFAALLRVHVPSSMVMVWFTNPLTVVPLLYAGWMVGSTITPPAPELRNLDYSWESMITATTHGWPVLFTGCFALAVVTAGVGYFCVLRALQTDPFRCCATAIDTLVD